MQNNFANYRETYWSRNSKESEQQQLCAKKEPSLQVER